MVVVLEIPPIVEALTPVLSSDQLTSLLELSEDVDAYQQKAAELLNLQDYKDNARCAILLDFYGFLLAFAKENHFDNEKTCTLLAIMKSLHDKSMDGMLDVGESFGLFQKTILQYSTLAQKPHPQPQPQPQPSLTTSQPLPQSSLQPPQNTTPPPSQLGPPGLTRLPSSIAQQQQQIQQQQQLQAQGFLGYNKFPTVPSFPIQAHPTSPLIPPTSPSQLFPSQFLLPFPPPAILGPPSHNPSAPPNPSPLPTRPTSPQPKPYSSHSQPQTQPQTRSHVNTRTAQRTAFTPSEIRTLTKFLSGSYFHHYTLYRVVFSQEQEIDEERRFVRVENAVIPPPLSQALNEQDWAMLQSKEKQRRIAEELSQIKDAIVTESMMEENKKEEGEQGAGEGGEFQEGDRPTHAAPPPPSFHHPHPLFHPPSFTSVSGGAGQSAETHKILESVNQATSAQIVQLRDALQRQFEEQEKQILDLISRVDTELAGEPKQEKVEKVEKGGDRKRSPNKPPLQNLAALSRQGNASTPKPVLASSTSSQSLHSVSDHP